MHERNIGIEHAGPGNRPNRPARLTRKLTLQKSPLQSTWGEHSEHPPIASEDAPSPATRSLHNIPWCGLRSRLGVVHLQHKGSDSTRHSNHQPSDGWQVRSERADLWQVFSRPIDHWQVHRRPAVALSCSGRCPHLAAVCLRVAAAWMQTAAVWLCLSAAAACLSPAAALHHAATASLLRPLLPPLVQLLPLPALDARARGTVVARDCSATLSCGRCTQLGRQLLSMLGRSWTTHTLVPPPAEGGKCNRLGWQPLSGPCRTWTTPS